VEALEKVAAAMGSLERLAAIMEERQRWWLVAATLEEALAVGGGGRERRERAWEEIFFDLGFHRGFQRGVYIP
jgi:hypothetical protein